MCSRFAHPLLVKFMALPDGASCEPFDLADIVSPAVFDRMSSTARRRERALVVAAHVRRALTDPDGDRPMTTPVPPEILAAHLSKNAFFSLTHGEIAFVTSQAEVGELGRRRAESDTVQAVERLVAWACDQDGTEPRLCALLGDLGTAWTTTSVLLTRELLNRRDEGKDVPLPIYFDLRDLDTERPPDLGLRTILDHLLRQAAATTAIDVDGALETIRSVHDLYSLARQPVLLSMIRHVLARVEEALVEHRRIRTAELYEELVEQWLSRDDGKHTLTPEHKLRLMGHLAPEGWASGTRAWEDAWMEDWLLRCLHNHPEMELHYDERMPTQRDKMS